LAALPSVERWGFDTGPIGDRELHFTDASGDTVMSFIEATTSLTEADIRALASLLAAQQAEIDALRQRIRDLERAVRN
jgi:hypothetical protein